MDSITVQEILNIAIASPGRDRKKQAIRWARIVNTLSAIYKPTDTLTYEQLRKTPNLGAKALDTIQSALWTSRQDALDHRIGNIG